MEIQKIFSEVSTEEKLYSISLNESEFELYQKIFGDTDRNSDFWKKR